MAQMPPAGSLGPPAHFDELCVGSKFLAASRECACTGEPVHMEVRSQRNKFYIVFFLTLQVPSPKSFVAGRHRQHQMSVPFCDGILGVPSKRMMGSGQMGSG